MLEAGRAGIEVRRPPGLSPNQPFEPIAVNVNPVRDWLRARQMELGDYFSPLKSANIRKLFQKYQHTNSQTGTPGTPVPVDPTATRFAVIGDFGDGSAASRAVAAQVMASRPAALLTVGDNVYPTGRERDWRKGWDGAGYAGFAATTPAFPALGNHDHYNGDLTPYFKRFPHLQGQAYYTWSRGGVDFFVLDTEQRLGPNSAQGKWLDAALGASAAPWKVVYMHRPMYSSAGVESNVQTSLRSALGPVIARHGVQLVLAGHEHSYERSQALEGTTYIVTGGGGAELRPFRVDRPTWSAYRNARHGFLLLDATPTALTVRAVDDQGQVFDTVQIPSGSGQATTGSAGGHERRALHTG